MTPDNKVSHSMVKLRKGMGREEVREKLLLAGLPSTAVEALIDELPMGVLAEDPKAEREDPTKRSNPPVADVLLNLADELEGLGKIIRRTVTELGTEAELLAATMATHGIPIKEALLVTYQDAAVGLYLPRLEAISQQAGLAVVHAALENDPRVFGGARVPPISTALAKELLAVRPKL